jgi:hypothetical protein
MRIEFDSSKLRAAKSARLWPTGRSFLHLLFSNMEDTDANSPTPEEHSAAPEAAPDVAPVPKESPAVPAPESANAVPSTPAPLPHEKALPEPGTELPAAGEREEAAPSNSEDPLAPLLAKSATQRLSIPEEEQAIALIRERLLGKKDEFRPAVELLPKVGWAIASKSVGSAWPDMKATAKNALVKILSTDESESSRRIRLSIGRSLFKVPDLAASLKMIVGVAKEIRDKDTGAVTAKDAQMFSNVTIGKGKPWIAQLSLSELKPAESELLVHAAVFAGFLLNQPPITQIGILKWAADADRLAKLHESAQALVVKGVGRMSAKWQAVLRKDVPNLPGEIAAALKPVARHVADTGETPAAEPEDDGLPAELKAEASASESTDVASSAAEAPPSGKTPSHRERPVYVSKTIPPREHRSPERTPAPAAPQQPPAKEGGKGAGARTLQFNPQDALRQLETHINFIKSELKAAETKLRSREHEETRRTRQKPDVPVIPGEPTPDELARLNVQLEARITELQSRIDDLTIDAEARATSAGAFASQPETNPDQQLRTLLSIKLQEAFADFLALDSQDPDIVVPQHYGTVLREVFAVLKAEGVPLAPPTTEAGNGYGNPSNSA